MNSFIGVGNKPYWRESLGNPAQHAQWLAEAATAAAQSGKVRLMIVWNVDFPFYTATDPMGGYAIFRPDGSCPGCDSLGAVMRR